MCIIDVPKYTFACNASEGSFQHLERLASFAYFLRGVLQSLTNSLSPHRGSSPSRELLLGDRREYKVRHH